MTILQGIICLTLGFLLGRQYMKIVMRKKGREKVNRKEIEKYNNKVQKKF